MDKDGIKGKSTQQIINDRIAGEMNGCSMIELWAKRMDYQLLMYRLSDWIINEQ